MKIYDMIEGKWLKEKKEKKKKKRKVKDCEDVGVETRLVTYDEEREYLESLNKKRISHKE